MKRLIPWLSIVVAVAACGRNQQNTETLGESIRSFNEGVRWQRFELAATSIPPRERSSFVEAMDLLTKDLKITDYEIVRVDRRTDKEARVQVKVSWYKDTEGTLHETHAMQTWQRKGKGWLMVDQSRYRGDEMPGLLERLRDEDEDKVEEVDPLGAAPDVDAKAERLPAKRP